MSPNHEPRLDPSRLEEDGGTWLVVGLGNPGSKYAQTRHNCGYMVTQRLVDAAGQAWRRQGLRAAPSAQVAVLRAGYGIDAKQLVAARTGTFMNESGGAVRALLEYYKIDTEHLLVVHDDIDLAFGVAKLKVGGSDGGHNGLKSIQNSLKTKDFARLRIGVGRPAVPGGDVINWVLGRFAKSELASLEDVLTRAVQCVQDVSDFGLAKAQARLHLTNPKG